ncbi:MAG: hypothetical protein PHG55_11525 [Verrucomicrobiota bacterium]|nr:hypothetical protein [Verrucomicrobiota bacterium]
MSGMNGHERIFCLLQTLNLLGVLGVLAVPLMGRRWLLAADGGGNAGDGMGWLFC